MSPIAVAVFAMGLRHGADPDHLAVIDNITRNAFVRMPRSSRFTGTCFALGHSCMVMCITTAAAMLGAALGHISRSVELIGAYASILTLIVMIVFNCYTLISRKPQSLLARSIPARLKNASHPLIAIPIGALFGLGFETSSQLLAYSTAFTMAEFAKGFLIGTLFCIGMIFTDTFDSLFVARIIQQPNSERFDARRPWIFAVTVIAAAVVCEETYELRFGVPLINETYLSIATVMLLLATAVYMIVRRKRIQASELCR